MIASPQRLGSTLRASRLRLVLAIVVVEGLLVLVDAIPWWSILVLAVAAFAVYVGSARQSFDDFHAIGPIGLTAEQSDDDQLRPGKGALGVEIDGQIVLKLQEMLTV